MSPAFQSNHAKTMKIIQCFATMILIAVMQSPAWSAERDLHDYWDGRCASCHGHAAQFARKFLRVEDGKLVGTHHKDTLEAFLEHHYLTPDLHQPVVAMLKAQATTVPVFASKCGGCQGTAADFARQSLSIQQRTLVGKKTGKPVADYLKQHGGVSPAEAKSVTEVLQRLVGEVRPL